MLNLTETEKKWIRENLDEPEKLINSDDVNELLDEMTTYMTLYCFDLPDHEINDLGRKVERMYDNIFDNN